MHLISISNMRGVLWIRRGFSCDWLWEGLKMTGSHLTHSLYTPKYMSELYTYNSQTRRKIFSATLGKFTESQIYAVYS